MNVQKQRKVKLPPLGMRIIKTAIAVELCFVVYLLLGRMGEPVNMVVAAIICLQPYMGDSRKAAWNRMLGTLIGAAYGLLLLVVLVELGSIPHQLLHYGLIPLGVLLTLYTTVCLGKSDTAGLASIIFVIIAMSYGGEGSPLIQVLHRLLDTLLGILIAIFVNGFRLPRQRHEEMLFLVSLDALLPDWELQMSSKLQIELNRLLDDGAKMAMVTWRIPTFLFDWFENLHLNLPAIVLDGAAVYDIKEHRYLEKTVIPMRRAENLSRYLKERGLQHFTYSIKEDMLLVYYDTFRNVVEEEDHEHMNKSSYRNYIQGSYHKDDEIVSLRVVDKKEVIAELERNWKHSHMAKYFRIVKRTIPEHPDYVMLYFYDTESTIEHKTERLLAYAQAKEAVWIGESSVSEKRHGGDRSIQMLRTIAHFYEPLGFRKRKK